MTYEEMGKIVDRFIGQQAKNLTLDELEVFSRILCEKGEDLRYLLDEFKHAPSYLNS